MSSRPGQENTATPVRIYVLWHPGFKRGDSLARRIYHWFRLPSADGIPVYFRSPRNNPDEIDLPHTNCNHDIIIPLVDSHMVASTTWRKYLDDLSPHPDSSPREFETHILPVAIDDTAYQAPASIRGLNFIRTTDSHETIDAEVLLSRLTEAICKILREAIDPVFTQPIRIFLSHAKADGTEIPRQIKNFIQSETQCHTFFDENDIPYGQGFAASIGHALTDDSAGLLVIQGDHYADRPWCRKEIRDFLTPKQATEASSKPPIIPAMPAVVVYNLQGFKSARTIPELGHSTCIQWSKDAARLAVVTLLREILFSNFYRLLAKREVEHHPCYATHRSIMLNRPPDHVIIESTRDVIEAWDKEHKLSGDDARKLHIHHPGHGLSRVELDGLKQSYPNYNFIAYGRHPDDPGVADSGKERYFGKFLAISVGNSEDILDSGLSDDHSNELLKAILHPLLKQQISLVYAGRLPNLERSGQPWRQDINFTHTFLDILLSERQSRKDDGKDAESFLPRLVNISCPPYSQKITVQQEAQWINTCSFVKLTREDAGLGQDDHFSPGLRSSLEKVICLSHMRTRLCGSLLCPRPGIRDFKFTACAHLFLGGKRFNSSGIMPGIWEEILCAFEAKKPCFLLGITRGAAGRLCHLLLDHKADLDKEFVARKFTRKTNEEKIESYLEAHPTRRSARQSMELLKKHIQRGRKKADSKKPDQGLVALLNNGLSEDENKTLLETTSFQDISSLIQKGLSKVIESKN
jgi:hypothetical protein